MKSLLRFFSVALVILAGLIVAFQLRSGSAGASAPGSVLLRADQEFADVVAATLPGVVSIDALPAESLDPRARMLNLLRGTRPGQYPAQLGSGVIVSQEGHVVTNYHVIDGAASVRVYLNDGRILQAQFVGGDASSDIAILKLNAEGLQPLSFGDSDRVRIGQGVFAVGNPLGLQETVTQGIISGRDRRALSEAANEFFQTDAAINQGNSGGPLLDLHGQLIGITNMVTTGGEGIAFAIPSNTVRRVFESIRDNGRFIRPWFGGILQPITPRIVGQLGLSSTHGALLLGTYEGSPAAAAGLQAGDVILAFNGKPILDPIDLRNRMAETPIGQKVEIQALRDGKESPYEVTLGREPY